MIRLLFPVLLVLAAAVLAHVLWHLDRERMKAAAVAVAAGGLVAAGLLMILLGD
jgi:hypothetical protein